MTHWVFSEYTDAFINGFMAGALIFGLIGLLVVMSQQDWKR